MISPNLIKEYLLEKFKNNYKLSSDSEEMMVPSLFARDDYKRHMSVNTHTGLWQCFKSGEKGNFFHLVAIIDKTSYNQAESKFMLYDPRKPINFQSLVIYKP